MNPSEIQARVREAGGQLIVLPDRSLRCEGVPTELIPEIKRLQFALVAILLGECDPLPRPQVDSQAVKSLCQRCLHTRKEHCRKGTVHLRGDLHSFVCTTSHCDVTRCFCHEFEKAPVLSFSAPMDGVQPGSQRILLENDNDRGESSYAVTASAPWVNVSPATGVTPTSVRVDVNQAGLKAGNYTSTLSIASVAGDGSMQPEGAVIVKLRVITLEDGKATQPEMSQQELFPPSGKETESHPS